MKEVFGQARANPAALIFPRNRSGSQEGGIAMSFEPDRGNNS
jgi:hypothetical protein